MKLRLAILLVAFLGAFDPNPSLAQWQLDGTALCVAQNDQYTPATISDGAGGAFFAWQDYRNGGDIYVRRINAAGVVQWAANGVALCALVNDQSGPSIASDGAGGAIVAWHDFRNGVSYDIYAQRINGSGVAQWAANGVPICTALNNQLAPTIVADGAGGAIVAWHDARVANYDIYAQRVNSSGAVQWAANGVALCTAANDQSDPKIVSDGASGAIVTWYDYRSSTNYDFYAQRVNASGVVQWAVNGAAICAAAGDQVNITIIADGAGGAIMTWRDFRSGFADVYAQRINGPGVVQWTANGIGISTSLNDEAYPTIVSDGAGGAIVTWHDARSGAFDIYAQRVDASGAFLWPVSGVALCTAPNDQYLTRIVSDGAAGAIVAWTDFRNGNGDVYTQRVDASGVVQWAADGVAICTNARDQGAIALIADGAGNAIAAWQDSRDGTGSDLYVQRIEKRYGYWGRPEPTLSSAADVRSDQGGHVRLDWYASGRDVLNQQYISHYSIWRAIDPAAAASLSGARRVGLSDIGKEFSGPAVREERTPTTDYFWELVGTQDAIYRSAYSFTAETSYDSTASGTATHQFQIVAHAYYSQYYNWPSNIVSGHSVDNLAPTPPLLLTAQRVGPNVNLKWNRAKAPDLRDYSVYRKTSAGVTPVPLNFLANSEDTVAVDAGAPVSALYYIVTAFDVHANQSAPSNEASVQATTGVGNTPSITALTVLQNQPNPFAGTTDLRVGLPANSDLSIEVYDVAGRRVRAERLAHQNAGWRTIPFDGRDDAGHALASGVYFYRVTASGTTVTNKMVIAR